MLPDGLKHRVLARQATGRPSLLMRESRANRLNRRKAIPQKSQRRRRAAPRRVKLRRAALRKLRMMRVERRPKEMEKKVTRLLIREAQGKQMALHQLQLP